MKIRLGLPAAVAAVLVAGGVALGLILAGGHNTSTPGIGAHPVDQTVAVSTTDAASTPAADPTTAAIAIAAVPATSTEAAAPAPKPAPSTSTLNKYGLPGSQTPVEANPSAPTPQASVPQPAPEATHIVYTTPCTQDQYTICMPTS